MPWGGAELLRLRQSGKRPVEHVVLSTRGPLPGVDHPMLWITDRQVLAGMDYSMLAGLDVEVATSMGCPLHRLVAIIKGISPVAESVFVTWEELDSLMIPIQWNRGEPLVFCPQYWRNDRESRDKSAKLYARLRKEFHADHR